MKRKEFKKLKVGDKVRIVSERSGRDWNSDGLMDKWLGKVMTIRGRDSDGDLKMEEDKLEWDDGWYWYPHMIAEKIVDRNPVIVEHLIKDNTTIVKLSDGRVGVAKCDPEDEFDICEGLRLATERAYGKREPYKKPTTVKEVKRPAKVGEWIKITDGVSPLGFYKNGDILKVYKIKKITSPLFSKPGVFCEMPVFFARNQVVWDTEYVVLEGYKPKKK